MMKLECISLSDFKPISISEANVICLGNFDGVHVGHRTLLREARKLRNAHFSGAQCGVFCFRTLPSAFLSNSPTSSLSTLEIKLQSFAEEGMDFAILAEFDELQTLSPHYFVNEILKHRCRCVAAVCGFNYHYGHKGAGNPATLRKEFEAGSVLVIDEIRHDGITVSSSRIRTLLADGNVVEAAKLLTHPYQFTAPVLHGKALGRKLGAPTVNQHFPEGMQTLRHGVYVTECTIDRISYRGVTNVGVRPTVDEAGTCNCETYLIGFSGELYGKELTISFLHFIRPEQKFETVDALRAQIAEDIITAKTF